MPHAQTCSKYTESRWCVCRWQWRTDKVAIHCRTGKTSSHRRIEVTKLNFNMFVLVSAKIAVMKLHNASVSFCKNCHDTLVTLCVSVSFCKNCHKALVTLCASVSFRKNCHEH